MNYKRNMQRTRLHRLVLVRYLFPLLAILLMIVSLYLPTLQYTTSESGTNDAISTATLMGNAWNSVREALFGTSEQLQATLRFSQAVLTVLILSVIFFTVGTVATVWASVGALRTIGNAEQSKTERALWITLFPNRIALSLWQLSLLPLLAFPRILVSLYRVMLANDSVSLSVRLIEPLTLGLLLLIAAAILSAITAPKERAARLDPFARTTVSKEEDGEEEEEVSQAESNDSAQLRKLREEQLLELRRMLNRESPSSSQENDKDEK